MIVIFVLDVKMDSGSKEIIMENIISGHRVKSMVKTVRNICCYFMFTQIFAERAFRRLLR